MLSDLRLAFIGAGAMGEAMVSGLLHQEIVSPSNILASEPRSDRRQELHNRYQISVTDDNHEAARWGHVLILAVKPQIMPNVLPTVQTDIPSDTLCISIAAGIPISTFVSLLNHSLVVRAMPNMPAQVGAGMTVWTATAEVNEQQHMWTRAILGALGEELFVEDESYIDMATALSGSGPAYMLLILEAMVDAGVHLGFSRAVAQKLANQTMFGAAHYAMQQDTHLAQLRNSATSPAGTTAAGLQALERGGVRSALSDAIWAAYQRARELGRKES